MAVMASDNDTYQNAPGILDVSWYRGNHFSMYLTFPYDISSYTYEASTTDKTGVEETPMAISVAASGLYSGTILCELTADEIDALPSNGKWFIDQINSAGVHVTMIVGAFSTKVRGYE